MSFAGETDAATLIAAAREITESLVNIRTR
jgi:hypothetical protein